MSAANLKMRAIGSSEASFDEVREVALARTGDVDAFERLVRHHADALYGFLLRWLRDEELARDVFQEATLRCYRNLHRLDERGTFRPWFFRIAVNRAKTMGSAARRRHEREGVRGHEGHAPSSEERLELASSLERVLASLSKTDRQLLLLRFVEGMSMREIASVMRIPELVVKMRVSRARKRFREAYGQIDSGVVP